MGISISNKEKARQKRLVPFAKTGKAADPRPRTRTFPDTAAAGSGMDAKIPGAGVRPSKSSTPSDRVYNFILDKLLSRQWPVKSKIMTETELSGELKVSRIAVREAVERLCAIGLLKKRQGAGTFVSEPMISAAVKSLFPMVSSSSVDVRKIHEFRRFFEYGNVILFMQYAGEEDISALEANYQEMISLPSDQVERGGLLDIEFHRLMALGTGNPFVIKISDILVELMRSSSTIMYYAAATQSNAIIYHNEIIRAIKNGDGDVAAMLMLRHINIAIECLGATEVSATARRR